MTAPRRKPANRWLYRRLAIGASWLTLGIAAALLYHRLILGYGLRLYTAGIDRLGVDPKLYQPGFFWPSELAIAGAAGVLISFGMLFLERSRREALILGFPLSVVALWVADDPYFRLGSWVHWLIRAGKGDEPFRGALADLLPETAADFSWLALRSVAIVLWPAAVYAFAFRAPKDDEFGTAHYLDDDQVEEIGLLSREGLLLAQWPLSAGDRWRMVGLRFWSVVGLYRPMTGWDAFPESWPGGLNVVQALSPETLPEILEPPGAGVGMRLRLLGLQVLAAVGAYDAETGKPRSLGWFVAPLVAWWGRGFGENRITPRMRSELRDDSETHILLYAPSGTGKSTAAAIPWLLDYPGAVVVLDRKMELWNLTAGYRSQGLGQACYLLDPTSEDTHSYNPCYRLLKARQTIYEDREAQRLAKLIIDPHGERKKGGTEEHFSDTAEDAIAALLLHLAYAHPKHCTFAGVLKTLAEPSRPLTKFLASTLNYPHGRHVGDYRWPHPSRSEGTLVHPGIASRARAVLDTAPNEQSGLISTVRRHLQAWRDPLIAGATHTCDFTPEDLVNGERPGSLYIAIPPSDMERTNSLIRLVLGSILEALIGSMDHDASGKRSVSPHAHPLLLVLDEFPTLGYWPKFVRNFLPIFRSYGMRAAFLVQGLNQIKGAYGQHEPIQSACGVKIVYRPNDFDTANALSQTLGEQTLHAQRESGRADSTDLLMEQRQIQESPHGRRLETPDELLGLPEKAAIVLAHGKRIRATQLRYHEDPTYFARTGWTCPNLPESPVVPASLPVPCDAFGAEVAEKEKAAAKAKRARQAADAAAKAKKKRGKSKKKPTTELASPAGGQALAKQLALGDVADELVPSGHEITEDRGTEWE